MRQKRSGWTFEGPVNLDGRRHCIDFRAYTEAVSEEEAARNIIWQYKIRFKLQKNANVELYGLLYKIEKLPHIAEKKKKVEYDYEQLEMNI